MKRFISYAALMLALSPVASFAASEAAVTSHVDYHLSVEKGDASRYVARDLALRELDALCTFKGGPGSTIVEVAFKTTSVWGGSTPIERVRATAVCRASEKQ